MSGFKPTISENIASNGGAIGAGMCKGVTDITTPTTNTFSVKCTDTTGVLTGTGTSKAQNAVLTLDSSTTANTGVVTWACATTTDKNTFH
jgi:hypothetical protein